MKKGLIRIRNSSNGIINPIIWNKLLNRKGMTNQYKSKYLTIIVILAPQSIAQADIFCESAPILRG